MMLAISAFERAPNKVITPARSQTPSRISGEPICKAITPGLRKIPEPITPPTTIMIVVNRPSEREERAPGRIAVEVAGFSGFRLGLWFGIWGL